MRFVSAEEVRAVLNFPLLVEALASAHRRPKIDIQDGRLGSEQELYFVRHAVDRGRFMASKLITSFPSNLTVGELPAVQAVLVLFDGTNGRPLVVMDGTEITYWRTAADSALGATMLAPDAPATLLMVGAGEMSRWLVRAHRAVRPSLRRVLIWNRSKERAAKVAILLTQEGIQAEAVEDLRRAVGLRRYARRQPLVEYKTEAFYLFETLLRHLNAVVTALSMRVGIVSSQAPAPIVERHDQAYLKG